MQTLTMNANVHTIFTQGNDLFAMLHLMLLYISHRAYSNMISFWCVLMYMLYEVLFTQTQNSKD